MRALSIGLTAFVAGMFFLACGGEKAPVRPKIPVVTTPNQPGAVLYRLPVSGSWRVFRTHYGATNDQAYALDLVVDTPPGLSTGPRTNASYPSYNQPIVADAAGVVVIAVDGIPDNPPGVVNRYDMHGNYVVIDHQNGEFSLFAHFIPGSLKVRPGMTVTAGTELGRCGNSGHTTMPHLHWQVMNNAQASGAVGIPPRYAPYQRNGIMTNELPNNGDRLFVR